MKIDVDDWYRRYAPMVYRRCRSILGEDEASLDTMQEVFMRLVHKADRITDQAPSSLLYTMATNLSLNHLKAGQARIRHFGAPDSGDTEIPTLDRGQAGVDARATLDQIFALDDEKSRTIAWLHYVDGYTLEETAEHAGMSVSGIRRRLRKLQGRARSFREAHL